MTRINGFNGADHNVDDILASIRTSIAEETGPARLVAGEMQLPVRRDHHFADEANEFELPAIFKPGHAHAPDRPNLFGRLSDALKTATPHEPPRAAGRTVIPFDPSAAGRMLEPPAASMGQRRQDSATPAMGGDHQASTPPSNADPAGQGTVKREMPTFFDTRINKLGELTRRAYEKPEEPEVKAEPEPVREEVHPPQLPDGALRHAGEAVDDAAAQLLRPMLRQWLQENMPKIVEKALLSEVQGHPPGRPRK